MKAEISGPRTACAIELFRSVDFDKVERVIAKMQAIFDDRKAKHEATESVK